MPRDPLLSARLEIEALFIAEGKPCCNGAVEQFNGWFQPLLLNRSYRRPADARRQVKRLMTTIHEHAHLGHRSTPAQAPG
jgi:hypothetical protein